VTRIVELGTTLDVTSNRRTLGLLQVTANVVPRKTIIVTLMKAALSTYKISVLTKATRRNISEDATLYSHRRGNLKSYKNVNLRTVANAFLYLSCHIEREHACCFLYHFHRILRHSLNPEDGHLER
jgi:hypothetical protein